MWLVASQFSAYRIALWHVAAICNRTLCKAQAHTEEFAPKSRATNNFQVILSNPSIDIVVVTVHPRNKTLSWSADCLRTCGCYRRLRN